MALRLRSAFLVRGRLLTLHAVHSFVGVAAPWPAPVLVSDVKGTRRRPITRHRQERQPPAAQEEGMENVEAEGGSRGKGQPEPDDDGS